MKHFLRIALSLGLSGVFLWIAVRGVSWQETAAALGAAHVAYVPLIFVVGVVSLYFRALRWGVLLRPMAKVSPQSLFSATAMGFAANMLLPLRAGEVLRPWLLARKENLPLAPTMATVWRRSRCRCHRSGSDTAGSFSPPSPYFSPCWWRYSGFLPEPSPCSSWF